MTGRCISAGIGIEGGRRPGLYRSRRLATMTEGGPSHPSCTPRAEPMTKPTLGNLPPRYSFILNPHSDIRLTRCPKCERLTHPRKFALFVHVEEWGGVVLGYTCRYCTRCELIIVHQDEL